MVSRIPELVNGSDVPLVDWRALVRHTYCVEADVKLDKVHDIFKSEGMDYLPVVKHGKFQGIVSRAQIGTLLGARFGFALYANKPISEHLSPTSSPIYVDDPLLPVLRTALEREQTTFYDDLVLLDRGERVLGVICVQALVKLQSDLLAQKLEQVQLQQEALNQRNVELQRSNRELQDFAYIASHDLQEPLRKIQAFADRLMCKYQTQLDAGAQDYLKRMQSASHRLQSLINDLLEFSRVTTRARPFEPVDLTALANDVVSDLEVRLEQSGGRVVIGDLPVVTGDTMQIRQLFQNLIGNALKFQKPGTPPVVTVAAEGENGTVDLIFTDNGIGFKEEYGEKIFGMFQRLHGREEYEGNGIGLAICRKIAQRHGGTILAHGQPNVGATFRVRLPRS